MFQDQAPRLFSVLLAASFLPVGAATSFLGYEDDFNNPANWNNGLPSNGGNDGTVTAPAVLTANFNPATGISYHLNINSTLDTAAFELQHRSGSNGRDLRVGDGAGTSGTLTVNSGGRLDIAGAGSDLFIGHDGGTGAVVFENGSTFQVSKAIEILNGSLTFQPTVTSGGSLTDELVVDDNSNLGFTIDGASYFTIAGGTLQVELATQSILRLDFVTPPTLGDTFDLVTGVSTFAGPAGTFGYVEANGLPANLAVQINYAAPLLQAEIIANPATDPQLGGQPFFAFTNNDSAETLTVPIKNDGPTETLNISGVTPTGTDLATVSAITNPASLAVGATGDITFTFTPAGSGTYTFNLEIASDDPASPGSIPVTVTVNDPLISVPTAPLDFGSFAPNPGPQTRTVTVTNDGGATDLTIDVLNTIVVGAPEFIVSSTPDPIAPGATGDIEITFDPGINTGDFTGTLEVVSDDFHGRVPLVGLAASVVSFNPELNVDPSFTFTNNGSAEIFAIPVGNIAGDGTTMLNISGVTPSGTSSDTVSAIAFPATIDAEASDEISFTFTQNIGPGFYDFNLEIVSDDASQSSPRVVAFTIEVQDPLIAVDINAIDFGTLSANPGPQTDFVTIFNDGGDTDLMIDDVNTVIIGDTEFTITSLPTTIAPGGSADLEITFAPGTAAGPFSATLEIVSDDYLGTTPQVTLDAFVMPDGPTSAADFGTVGSPIAAGYTGFVSAEGASQTIGGVTLSISSRDTNITAGTGAQGGNDLTTDTAQTSFNGSEGNYISVLLSGFSDGTLEFISYHNYATSGYGLPIDVLFGEQGTTLALLDDNVSRIATVTHSTTVEAGKIYELRILEQGNANTAYLSGLLMWGTSVPGGTAYDSFVTDAGLDPATDGAPGLDPDGDDVKTGIEWVVGGSPNDPANPDTDKLPTGARVTADPDGDLTDSDYLLFTYRRTDESASDPDTSIEVEYGSDLVGWTPATNGVDGVVLVETDDGFGTGIDQVDVYVPVSLAINGKLFSRLNVTIATP